MKRKKLKKAVCAFLCVMLLALSACILCVPEKTAEYKESILFLQEVSDSKVEFAVGMKNYKRAVAYPVIDEKGNLDWYISVKVNLLSKIFSDSNTLNNIIIVNKGGWKSLQEGSAAEYSFTYEGTPKIRNIYYTEMNIENEDVNRETLAENAVLVWSSEKV